MSGFDSLDDRCGEPRGSAGAIRFQQVPSVSDERPGGRALGFAARMHQLPEDRKHLIFRIRRQIAENSYDTPQKLEIAIERLFDSLE